VRPARQLVGEISVVVAQRDPERIRH
jgi:hypothetical protein